MDGARRLDRFCEEFKRTPNALWTLDSSSAVDMPCSCRDAKSTGLCALGSLILAHERRAPALALSGAMRTSNVFLGCGSKHTRL